MADELRGWKDIGAYLGTSERTAQRWEHEYGMPVRRTGRTRGASVFALRNELDHWRLSDDGLRASSDTTQATGTERTPQPPPEPLAENGAADPVPAAPRALITRAAVAVLALLIVVTGVVAVAWLMRGSNAAVPNVEPMEAFGVPVSETMFELKVTAADGTPFLFHVLDGALATIEVRGEHKLGLMPVKKGDQVRVTADKITVHPNGTETIAEVQTLPLRRATPVQVNQAGMAVTVEWVGMVQPAVLKMRPPDAPPLRCCVVCGKVVACASQVTASCGSCCGTPGCRK